MTEWVPLPVDIVWPVVEGLLAEIRAKSVALAMLRSIGRPRPEARFLFKNSANSVAADVSPLHNLPWPGTLNRAAFPENMDRTDVRCYRIVVAAGRESAPLSAGQRIWNRAAFPENMDRTHV